MALSFKKFYPFIPNLIPRMHAAISIPPKEVFGRLLLKSGWLPYTATKMTLLGELERKHPARLSELMLNIEKEFTIRSSKQAPSYKDKNIIEIGCGLSGGIGTLAIIRDTSSYLGLDPNVIPEIFYDKDFRHQHLKVALNETAKMENVYDESSPYIKNFYENCCYTQCSLEDLSIKKTKYDLAVSISCLEHILQLDKALEKLKLIMSPDAQHFHLINFSNHLSKTKPFSKIYEMPPLEYWRRHGNHINLFRPKDIKNTFNRAGWNVDITIIDSRVDALPSNTMHSWWSENYDYEELAIRTAVISSTSI